jgi:hypothetical protein
MLTDGQVDDRESVINKANTKKDNIRVHTFGVGEDCDVDMVRRMAKMGRGSCSLVGNDVANLSEVVVTALRRASEPSLQDCKLEFAKVSEDLGEVFCNELLARFKIICRADFKSLQLKFTCQKDCLTGNTIEMQYDSDHFERVKEGFGLFKQAAQKEISRPTLQVEGKILQSIKY